MHTMEFYARKREIWRERELCFFCLSRYDSQTIHVHTDRIVAAIPKTEWLICVEKQFAGQHSQALERWSMPIHNYTMSVTYESRANDMDFCCAASASKTGKTTDFILRLSFRALVDSNRNNIEINCIYCLLRRMDEHISHFIINDLIFFLDLPEYIQLAFNVQSQHNN